MSDAVVQGCSKPRYSFGYEMPEDSCCRILGLSHWIALTHGTPQSGAGGNDAHPGLQSEAKVGTISVMTLSTRCHKCTLTTLRPLCFHHNPWDRRCRNLTCRSEEQPGVHLGSFRKYCTSQTRSRVLPRLIWGTCALKERPSGAKILKRLARGRSDWPRCQVWVIVSSQRGGLGWGPLIRHRTYERQC